MLLSIIPFSAMAVDYEDLYLQGLADPTVTKNVENYDGYHFVKGTKATWDCKLYTLTATVTSLSGNIATFDIKFNSKIPKAYCTLDGWYGYNIHVASNLDSGTDYFPSDSDSGKIKLRVNVAKNDIFSESAAAGGSQFIKIKVTKLAREDWWFPLDDKTPYRDEIVKNRQSDGSGVHIENTYALSYYVTPTYKVNVNTIKVSSKAIALGTYAFDGEVYYKCASDRAAKKQTIAKNKNIVLSGLKAGTPYSIRLVCKVPFTDPESGQKKYNMDYVGKAFSVTTSLTVKPSLSKVTVSKVKYGKKKVNGYWETRSGRKSVWHPAETFNTATYYVTVKLRNVPKNAKGLYLKVGSASYYISGRKGTYTYKLYYQAKKSVKGKKMACSLYYSSNTINKKAVGFSPGRAITYKIKNSSTNYKK